jgi:hypothetical protein
MSIASVLWRLLLVSFTVHGYYICFNYFSSDDCSGDLKIPSLCYHDGECNDNGASNPAILVCNGDTTWFAFNYGGDDPNCDGAGLISAPFDHVCCKDPVAPGVLTMNSSCVPTVPTGAKLWNNLNATEKAVYN